MLTGKYTVSDTTDIVFCAYSYCFVWLPYHGMFLRIICVSGVDPTLNVGEFGSYRRMRVLFIVRSGGANYTITVQERTYYIGKFLATWKQGHRRKDSSIYRLHSILTQM